MWILWLKGLKEKGKFVVICSSPPENSTIRGFTSFCSECQRNVLNRVMLV